MSLYSSSGYLDIDLRWLVDSCMTWLDCSSYIHDGAFIILCYSSFTSWTTSMGSLYRYTGLVVVKGFSSQRITEMIPVLTSVWVVWKDVKTSMGLLDFIGRIFSSPLLEWSISTNNCRGMHAGLAPTKSPVCHLWYRLGRSSTYLHTTRSDMAPG